MLKLLNSKLMRFYFGFIGIMTAGGAYTLKHQAIAQFPIKNSENKEIFVNLVDNILNKKLAIEPTHELEDRIELLVYKLKSKKYEQAGANI